MTVLAITAAATLPAGAAKAVSLPAVVEAFIFPGSDGAATIRITCSVPVTSVTGVLTNHLGGQVARYRLELVPGCDPMNGRWTTGPMTGIALGNYRMR